MVRRVQLEDANAIVEIYNYYILNSIATFEETAIDAIEMKNRIQQCTARHPWLVFEEKGEIIGYAYAGEWKSRCSYKYSVESSVYLKHNATKKGVGTILYSELIKQLKKTDLHVIIGGISLPNEPSIYLHEKFGFEKIAHFKEVGNKFNKWIDVGYWELLIENK